MYRIPKLALFALLTSLAAPLAHAMLDGRTGENEDHTARNNQAGQSTLVARLADTRASAASAPTALTNYDADFDEKGPEVQVNARDIAIVADALMKLQEPARRQRLAIANRPNSDALDKLHRYKGALDEAVIALNQANEALTLFLTHQLPKAQEAYKRVYDLRDVRPAYFGDLFRKHFPRRPLQRDIDVFHMATHYDWADMFRYFVHFEPQAHKPQEQELKEALEVYNRLLQHFQYKNPLTGKETYLLGLQDLARKEFEAMDRLRTTILDILDAQQFIDSSSAELCATTSNLYAKLLRRASETAERVKTLYEALRHRTNVNLTTQYPGIDGILTLPNAVGTAQRQTMYLPLPARQSAPASAPRIVSARSVDSDDAGSQTSDHPYTVISPPDSTRSLQQQESIAPAAAAAPAAAPPPTPIRSASSTRPPLAAETPGRRILAAIDALPDNNEAYEQSAMRRSARDIAGVLKSHQLLEARDAIQAIETTPMGLRGANLKRVLRGALEGRAVAQLAALDAAYALKTAPKASGSRNASSSQGSASASSSSSASAASASTD